MPDETTFELVSVHFGDEPVAVFRFGYERFELRARLGAGNLEHAIAAAAEVAASVFERWWSRWRTSSIGPTVVIPISMPRAPALTAHPVMFRANSLPRGRKRRLSARKWRAAWLSDLYADQQHRAD